MKPFIATLFFLQTCIFCQGQYKPTLNNGSIWITHEVGLGFDEWYDISVSNDTTINEKVYQKIISSFDRFDEIFLREDTLTQQIHHFDIYDSTEHLLYDFNLSIGDTVNVYQNNYPLIVISKDSILKDSITIQSSIYNNCISLNSFYNKITVLNYLDHEEWGNIYWIEGIGALTGLIDFISGPQKLTCFLSEQNERLYHNQCEDYGSNNEECFIGVLGLNEFNNYKTSIYPNPFNSFLELKSKEPIQIRVFNIYNQQQEINFDVNGDQYRIDGTNLETGVYIIELSNETGVLTTSKVLKK